MGVFKFLGDNILIVDDYWWLNGINIIRNIKYYKLVIGKMSYKWNFFYVDLVDVISYMF